MIVKYTTLRRFRMPITIIGIGYITWFFLLPRFADRKHAESLRFRHSGQFQQALKCMDAAILLDSKKENYHWGRALTYWLMYNEDRTNTDFLRRAKTDWLKAIDLKHGDASWSGWSEVFFGLAQVEYKLGEVKQGVINYKKAFQYSVDPVRRATIASILGYIYFISKDYSEAVIWLDRVPEGRIDYLDSCLRNARSNHRLNNFERAEELYLKVLSIKPDDAHLNAYIAHLYVQTRQLDKVIRFLQHGLKLLEDVGLVFATLGNDNFSTRSWNSDEYLKMYESFFDEFQSELQSYAWGEFEEDCLELKKLGAFYRSVNKVVVRSLENPDPAVAEYAEKLLEKIKQAGLFKAVSDDEGLELKNSDGEVKCTRIED